MDNLTYSYSGNRLNSVTDAVSGNHEVDFVPRGNNVYTYYSNGNLKSDANEQISNIEYNTFLNQPKLLTLADGRTITAAYDGGGNLQKTSYSNGETWHYVDGFVIKNGQLYSINIPDGRLIKNASGGWDKEFNYSDHLGNSRVSFKAENGALVQTAKTDFDPWGIILRSSVSNSVSNRFEMQGKESEKTFGLNRTNFGFRSYNPTIGRWDRVDILSEKYSNMSTYQYCANNPLRYIDPDGMQIDPASQSEWDKQKDAVTNQRDRLQGRIDKLTAKAENKGWSAEKLAGKVGNLSERVSSLNGSLSTLSTLESSKQVYSLSASSGEVGGTALDPSTGNIQISYSGTSNFVHEATHAGQFESGDIAFDKKSGMTYGHDLGDEISAYKAQFAYDPTSISGLRSTSSPNSFGGINSSWVQGISTSTGSQPYTQHGLIPVNMSTTRDALIQAYPQAASGLKNMPSNYSLKSVPTIFYKR
jgi:RHS repeat-associated protein